MSINQPMRALVVLAGLLLASLLTFAQTTQLRVLRSTHLSKPVIS
jgi:hypothetical protein